MPKWNEIFKKIQCHFDSHDWDSWVFIDPGLEEVPIGHFKKRKCKHCPLIQKMHGIHSQYYK
jgi:hypothetical protein